MSCTPRKMQLQTIRVSGVLFPSCIQALDFINNEAAYVFLFKVLGSLVAKIKAFLCQKIRSDRLICLSVTFVWNARTLFHVFMFTVSCFLVHVFSISRFPLPHFSSKTSIFCKSLSLGSSTSIKPIQVEDQLAHKVANPSLPLFFGSNAETSARKRL